jgi:hypothetical protein
VTPVKRTLVAFMLFASLLGADYSAAESWVQFHAESWNFYSEKLRRKLDFSNRFFYDSDSVRRNGNGAVKVWLKEIADNDRFYVGKGTPAKETSFKQLQFWCDKRKFSIITGEEDAGQNELLSEEISPGTQFALLYDRICTR